MGSVEEDGFGRQNGGSEKEMKMICVCLHRRIPGMIANPRQNLALDQKQALTLKTNSESLYGIDPHSSRVFRKPFAIVRLLQ